MKKLALLTAASAQTYGVGKAKRRRRRRLLPKAERSN